ncbi:MAG: type II toxin-antitoxin system HipA family toxin [Gammaproteobacteria bacterium]|nr:type II toxin-antitoxin system HipA family toxin [Gammaproteobacteria bacterium]
MDQRRRITVLLGNDLHLVGELIFEAVGDRQHSAFRYHEEWLENPIAFAISPAMPLRSGWDHFSGSDLHALPDPIADTAPDSWGRSVIRTRLGRDVSEIEMLLAVSDISRVGALRFMDEQGEIQSTDVPPLPRMSTLSDLRKLNARYEVGEGNLVEIARALRGTGDSLGGARPKSVVDIDDGLAIAKYTSEYDTMPVERMEVATLRLAAEVGIRASPAWLELDDSPHPVAIIRRFDRTGQRRHHYISARSFLNKRSSDAPAYYTDLVEVMRGNCGDGDQALYEIRELYKRILFTILVSNTDDHLKNHGYLHAGGSQWMLSPAFDINPQPFRQALLKTGISELSGFEPSIEALIEASFLFEIDESEAASMVLDMATTIRDSWRMICADVDMTAAQISQYAPAFEHRQMVIALAVGKGR